MTSALPPRPNLDFYRKQAKQLVRDVRAGAAQAFERMRPQLRHIVSLADAQLVIAREQGFESWAAFQQSVARSAEGSPQNRVGPGAALSELAELLQGDAFAAPRGSFEQLRAALGWGDASGAALCACGMLAALRKLAQGDALEADGRRSTPQRMLEPAAIERAKRAYSVLERVIREESLDLSVVHCSFCLKGAREVVKLIRGQEGYICDACTSVAVDILQRQAD
jgi:hypothetical protein